MYGLVDYHIAQELAKLIDRDKPVGEGEDVQRGAKRDRPASSNSGWLRVLAASLRIPVQTQDIHLSAKDQVTS